MKQVTLFKEEDISNLKMLLAVIRGGDFKIKGEAVARVANVFSWAESLEHKIQYSMNENKKPKIKKLENANL